MLLRERIDIDTLQHILRLVLPAHFGIRTCHPQLALRNHVGIVGIMVDNIIERTYSSEEVSFMELRLTQTNPRQTHIGVKFFGFEP